MPLIPKNPPKHWGSKGQSPQSPFLKKMQEQQNEIAKQPLTAQQVEKIVAGDEEASLVPSKFGTPFTFSKPESLEDWKEPGMPEKPKEPSRELVLLKVGADVEEFLRDKAGKPVPVIGLIGGTKSDPMPILTSLGKGFALQEDNVALEYNIPPSADKYGFVYSLMRIREEINARVASHGLVPAIEASMHFDPKQLEHEQAKVFGCDPDFNVWEQKVNEKPSVSPDSATLRTAGGHVHISFLIDKKAPQRPDDLGVIEALVMGLDIYLGVPFSLIDKDKDRNKLYGKAGAFRPKDEYGGVEYRVLSNHWTKSPALMGYVFDQVKTVFCYLNNHSNARSKFLDYKSRVYSAINDHDESMAHHLIHRFGVAMPSSSAR